MTQIVRRFSWLTAMMQADPDFAREKTYGIEYEFSAPEGAPADERTHENGRRVFRAHHDRRGPYAPEEE